MQDESYEFEAWVGAVMDTIEVYPIDDGVVTICPSMRPGWQRFIRESELKKLLDSGGELQYHEIGYMRIVDARGVDTCRT